MAPSNVTTTVTELPESRVRVEAEVAPSEVEKRVEQAARSLARNLRVPGFRAGKAPPPLIIKRVGREAVLDEAVRGSLPGWYTAAIDDAHIAPIGEPELDMGELPPEGQPLKFSIEIGVRPKAELGDYKELEVGRRSADVPDQAIDAEIEQLRERSAKLETVDRPAGRGDFVVMDYNGSIDGTPFAGGEGRDQMVELGSGRLVPGFEEQLEGASAGEERTIQITFPDDYPGGDLAGKQAEFAISVKEIKAKELPEVDDDLAIEAGFDTLDELRADVRERLGERLEAQIEAEFREAALDSAVKAAKVEVPDSLVEARARELWEQMIHQLSHQGIDKQTYLRISGREEDEIVEAGKEDAEQALRREAVLAAIVEAEGIEPSEEELLEAVGSAAGERGSPKKLLDRLRSTGRLDQLKEDLAQRRALDVVAESAKPITIEQAQARDKLWTPGGEAEGAPSGSGLWTPGS
jgi:trigger factor